MQILQKIIRESDKMYRTLDIGAYIEAVALANIESIKELINLRNERLDAVFRSAGLIPIEEAEEMRTREEQRAKKEEQRAKKFEDNIKTVKKCSMKI